MSYIPGLIPSLMSAIKTAYIGKMPRKKEVLKFDSKFSSVLSKNTKQQTPKTKQGRLHLHFAPKIVKIH